MSDQNQAEKQNAVSNSELIEPLETEEQTLLMKLSACRKNIATARLEWFKTEYGIVIGSIVQDSKGNIYKVTSIDTCWNKRPWLQGLLKKKDGAFGTGIRNIYSDWTLLSR